jgi:hypothetical protein
MGDNRFDPINFGGFSHSEETFSIAAESRSYATFGRIVGAASAANARYRGWY